MSKLTNAQERLLASVPPLTRVSTANRHGHDWTQEHDSWITQARLAGASATAIAKILGISRETLCKRLDHLSLPMESPLEAVTIAVNARACLPAGHPTTWGLITKGTCLEGIPYPKSKS